MLTLPWKPLDFGKYRYRDFEARQAPNGWRLFENGAFLFGAETPREIELFVVRRMKERGLMPANGG